MCNSVRHVMASPHLFLYRLSPSCEIPFCSRVGRCLFVVEKHITITQRFFSERLMDKHRTNDHCIPDSHTHPHGGLYSRRRYEILAYSVAKLHTVQRVSWHYSSSGGLAHEIT